MKTKIVKKLLIAFFVFLALILVNTKLINADKTNSQTYNVNYRIIDQKTNQLASIDEAFIKPAKIKIIDNQYQVNFNIDLLGPIADSGLKYLTINNKNVSIRLLKNIDFEKIYQVKFNTPNLNGPLVGQVMLEKQQGDYRFLIDFSTKQLPPLNSKDNNISYAQSNSNNVENKNNSDKNYNDKLNSKKMNNSLPKNNKKDDLKAKKDIKNNKLNPVFLSSIGLLFAVVAVGYYKSLNHK